jgi:hypothetical protein
MVHHRPSIFLAGLFALATLARADAPAAARYCEVAMELSIDGRRIAAPSAIVEFGKEAEITIGDEAAHAWRFRILADEPTVVRRASVIPVSVGLYEVAEGREYLRASPDVKLAPGQRADVETIFPDGDGRSAHIAMVANPRSDAEIEALRADAGED